jgi:hypothetical protein
MALNQYLTVHKYILKNSHVEEDFYRKERREALIEKDNESYKYFTLLGLSKEQDLFEQVLNNLCAGIEGFTQDLFERDTAHYKMNRLCWEQVTHITSQVQKSF